MATETLVINLFGEPGAGKSTTRALVFGELKLEGVSCEEAPEFAKELVYEGRHKALAYQQYIMGKQMWRVARLFGEVDVVVTDSPILLGLVYGRNYPQCWEDYLLEVHNSWRTINFHLVRDEFTHPYDPRGRTQKSAAEARKVGSQIELMLRSTHTPYQSLFANDAVEAIVRQVLDELG